jgi:hypothetical protein
MNQAALARSTGIICPACGQEGQRITCSSGCKSEVVVYHSRKKFHTTCRISGNGNAQSESDEVTVNEEQQEPATERMA